MGYSRASVTVVIRNASPVLIDFCLALLIFTHTSEFGVFLSLPEQMTLTLTKVLLNLGYVLLMVSIHMMKGWISCYLSVVLH
jgi:hypothetical protein